jgi:hypothetical protein
MIWTYSARNRVISITHSQGQKADLTKNRTDKTNWADHILLRNSLQKHIIEGKVQKNRRDGTTRK